jgi:hypothetical protein
MIKKQYENISYMSGNGTRRPTIQHEAMEQEALFSWAWHMQHSIPELTMLYHIPNGGRRDRAEAANLKRQGVKAGVPDICLPVARGGFHGLYIELKAGNNKPTEKQETWIFALREQGYQAVVCNGWDAARETILKYLRGEKQ